MLNPITILSEALPLGLKANFAAVPGMSLGSLRPDPVGADTPAACGTALAGIATVPLPVLAGPRKAVDRRCGRLSLVR